MPRTNITGQGRRQANKAYERARQQQPPETGRTGPTEQPVVVALHEMLQLELQHQQAQQQAIPALQPQQGAQFLPVPFPAGGEALQTRMAPLLQGPSVITIQGSAYHRTAHLHQLKGQQPKYAELYIMDTAEALEHRANNPTNRELNKDTIKKLQDELPAVNPYAQEYKNIGNILQQQQQQATAANAPIPTFDMIITSRVHQDHRYHSPAAAEIAAIYSTKDGAAPNPNDRIIHIQRHDCYLTDIKATNPVANPLTYPTPLSTTSSRNT
eukprot:gene18468-biopygen15556